MSLVFISCKKLDLNAICKNSNLFPKKMKFIQIFFFLYFLFSYNHAYAYIDPGTGGILLQALLGLVAAVGAYITLYWRKFKNFVNKIFKIKK
ncbi:hypothetical protein OAW36_02745 [Pelagibacteraceae bacterium]|nr:hypothetical protein [Pelagibacteraceae bacterium]